jgi:hypothetical protein
MPKSLLTFRLYDDQLSSMTPQQREKLIECGTQGNGYWDIPAGCMDPSTLTSKQPLPNTPQPANAAFTRIPIRPDEQLTLRDFGTFDLFWDAVGSKAEMKPKAAIRIGDLVYSVDADAIEINVPIKSKTGKPSFYLQGHAEEIVIRDGHVVVR